MPYSAVNNSIVIQNWYANTTYSIYDVTAGLNIGNTGFAGPLYFSTINGNIGNNPSGRFIYTIDSYSRSNDLATINITTTGTQTGFARGSLYAITGLPDLYMNATGMILNSNPNGANGISLQFINPGPYVASTATSLGAVNCPEPSWTSGFFWSPTYSSQWEVNQAVIKAQFEANYQQRQPQGISPNINVWTLAFNDRTDTEGKGIMAFVQNLAGTYSTQIILPPNRLFNNPTLKFVLSNAKLNTKSYGLSDCSVVASQVFEW